MFQIMRRKKYGQYSTGFLIGNNEKAKALYMFVKPGEYANYPKGKQDAAHVRDSGAYFYAKAAVEMARRQGLSLADLWKSPDAVQFVPSTAN